MCIALEVSVLRLLCICLQPFCASSFLRKILFYVTDFHKKNVFPKVRPRVKFAECTNLNLTIKSNKISVWIFLLICEFHRLPRSDADQAIEVNHPFDGTGMLDEDEENFQRALALSRQEIDMEDEEADLRRAIQLSMQGAVLI